MSNKGDKWKRQAPKQWSAK